MCVNSVLGLLHFLHECINLVDRLHHYNASDVLQVCWSDDSDSTRRGDSQVRLAIMLFIYNNIQL